jgi:hypothetical protein
MLDILVILLPMLAIGLITWYFLRSRRPRKSKAVKDTHSTRQDRAVWAWAKVISATRGTTDLSDRTRVEMQLEVHFPGSQPYQATTTWLVEQEALVYVEEGKEISLKVDPLGPQYVYPNGPWARFVE